MKIQYPEVDKVEINDLSDGDVFKRKGDYYILTGTDQDCRALCVELECGKVFYLETGLLVEPVDASLLITPKGEQD